MQQYWCVVPAAGCGRRVGGDCPKQYLPLAGRPLIEHTLKRLANHRHIAGLMVVLAEHDARWPGVSTLANKPVHTATGGAQRCDSVLAGLEALPAKVGADDFVLVHDAARPCVRTADITRLVESVSGRDGGLLAVPVRETLKRSDKDQRSICTESREGCWRAFTPQMFRRSALQDALRSVRQHGAEVSDEAMAMELAGYAPLLVEGAEDNIKVTTREDFAMAEFLLARML